MKSRLNTLIGSVVILCLVLSTSISKAQVCFAPEIDFGVSNPRPQSMTSADFNNDGWGDFAVLNTFAKTFTVYLNDQSGGYTLTTYPSGGEDAWQIINADFNGDGFPDLALALSADGNGAIFINNQHGAFSVGPLVHVAPGGGTYSITSADFNNDGKADVALSDLFDNVVGVALGNGNGTFGTVSTFTTDDGGANSPNSPQAITNGDFDGDGNIDLVTVNNGGVASILLGDGSGGFGFPATFGSFGCANDLLSADFNHDGKLDLAIPNTCGSKVSIFKGNGNGTFQTKVDYSVGISPNAIIKGDFNGDGVIDLATVNPGSGDVSVLVSNLTGGFGNGTFQTAVSLTAAASPWGLAAGDFNHDSKLDIAACNLSSDNTSIFLNTGTFSSPFTLSFDNAISVSPDPPCNTPFAITSADFNEDGKMDLAVANSGDSYVTIFIGNGNGTFKGKATYAISTGATSIYTSDLAGSGHKSLVTTNADDSLSVLLGHGDGTFDNEVNYTSVHLSNGHGPVSVVSGEFLPDIATNLMTANSDGTISAFGSNATGQFNAPSIFYGPISGAAFSGITTADFNHDGNKDLAFTDANNGVVYELICNNGLGGGSLNGGSTLNATLTAGSDPFGIANADFNGDGFADLAVINYNDNNVSVFLNNGSGGFGTATNFNVGANPTSIATADFNGDGKIDLVTANSGDATISVLLGNGSGSFGTANSFAVGNSSQYSPQGVTAADYNGDGFSDLATANPNGTSNPGDFYAVTVLLSAPATWTGAVNTDWNNTGNWCSGILPTATTDVIITGSVAHEPTINSSSPFAVCNNLTIGSGHTLTIVTSGDLKLHGNLTLSGTYTHTGGTLELVGSTVQSIPAITAFDVIVNNSAGINLKGYLTVNGVLTLTSGKVTTGANFVIVSSTSSTSLVAGGSNTNFTLSWINGNLTRYFSAGSSNSYDFPLGDATYGRLATVKSNSLTGPALFFGYFRPLANGNDGQLSAWETSFAGLYHTPYTSMNTGGCWVIEPDAQPTAGNYDIQLYFNGFTGLVDNKFGILKRPTNSTTFADFKPDGGTLNTTNGLGRKFSDGYALRKGLTTFSEFGIGESGVILPIQLTSFTAEKCDNNANALLKWTTATELNNKRFDIEEATMNNGDDLTFTKIGEVEGNGTSEIAHNYQFIDVAADKSGARYYRLNQVDVNGNITYSDLKVLSFDVNGLQAVSLSPNPNNGQFVLAFNWPANENGSVEVTNMLGENVLVENVTATNGTVSKNIVLPEDISSGIYFLKLRIGNSIYSTKVNINK